MSRKNTKEIGLYLADKCTLCNPMCFPFKPKDARGIQSIVRRARTRTQGTSQSFSKEQMVKKRHSRLSPAWQRQNCFVKAESNAVWLRIKEQQVSLPQVATHQLSHMHAQSFNHYSDTTYIHLHGNSAKV